jgi:hypothetical protein
MKMLLVVLVLLRKYAQLAVSKHAKNCSSAANTTANGFVMKVSVGLASKKNLLSATAQK